MLKHRWSRGTLGAVLTIVGLLTVSATPATAATSAAASASAAPYCSINISTGTARCATTLSELQSGSATLATQYLLGRFYDQAGRTGPYLDIFASGPCDTNADLDWAVSNIGTAWNDRVSSFQGYSQCEIRVYENDSFSGASFGPSAGVDYVGDAMNDRTTSMRFY